MVDSSYPPRLQYNPHDCRPRSASACVKGEHLLIVSLTTLTRLSLTHSHTHVRADEMSAATTSTTTITAQAVKETFSVGVQWVFVVLGVVLLAIQLSVAVAVYRLARKIDAFILFLSEVGEPDQET